MMRGHSTGVWNEGKDLKMETHLKTGIIWDETGYIISNLSITAVFVIRLYRLEILSSNPPPTRDSAINLLIVFKGFWENALDA